MKNAITIRREVELVERQDGQAIAAARPVACDCCGKLCTVRFFEMSNGARFGQDCAQVFDLTSKQCRFGAMGASEYATFLGATKKQLAYMAAE